MTTRTCPRCSTVTSNADAVVCASCGQAFAAAIPLSREEKSRLYGEITRLAREGAWHAHVPTNRFLERQHRALRTAIALVAATLILLVPVSVVLNRAAQVRFEHGGGNNELLGSLLLFAAAVCVLLGVGAFYLAYRIVRSFRAYRRAPLERCAALVVTKRRMTLDKAGRKVVAFVTLEFASGEQREYRADHTTYELADARRAGLAYLRANHLLDLKLVPA
ncbi:MAG: hypothetical protein H6831_00180 [Planctomycetes bacterium]|nr:hypothetical protein [Planctomycetota bacterium]MCB9902802.1 hypothetical protein [Planctomycetota bacterium]